MCKKVRKGEGEPGDEARDDLSTMDKSPAPSVSAVQKFHCSMNIYAFIMVTYDHNLSFTNFA